MVGVCHAVGAHVVGRGAGRIVAHVLAVAARCFGAAAVTGAEVGGVAGAVKRSRGVGASGVVVASVGAQRTLVDVVAACAVAVGPAVGARITVVAGTNVGHTVERRRLVDARGVGNIVARMQGGVRTFIDVGAARDGVAFVTRVTAAGEAAGRVGATAVCATVVGTVGALVDVGATGVRVARVARLARASEASGRVGAVGISAARVASILAGAFVVIEARTAFAIGVARLAVEPGAARAGVFAVVLRVWVKGDDGAGGVRRTSGFAGVARVVVEARERAFTADAVGHIDA